MLKRGLLLFFALILLLIVNAFLNPFPKKNVPVGFKPTYGVSFSFEQAGWYGLDPRQAFLDLLDQVRVDWVRLPFFWDQMVGGDGSFNQNFEDLRWAIAQAQKRNVQVIVALGAKTPYYPEYHLPKEISSKIEFGEVIGLRNPVSGQIIDMDKKVVGELSSFDNISAWQVENEPFLANINNWKIGADLLAAEVAAVKRSDPKRRPIILNSVAPTVFDNSYKKLSSILEPGDILGVNAYFKTQGVNLYSFSIFGSRMTSPWPKWLTWSVQSWVGFSANFGALKNEAAKQNVRLLILEMQAEPYVRTLEDAKVNTSYRPADILAADSYIKAQMVESVGLWGAPYWIYKAKIGDKSWIDTVRSIVN